MKPQASVERPVVMTLIKPYEPDPRVKKEADALVGRGHRIHILAWDYTGSYPREEDAGGFVVERLGPRMPARRPSDRLWKRAALLAVWLVGGLVFSWRAARRARTLRPRLLHAHDLNTLQVAVAASLGRGTPILYDSHEDYPKLLAETNAVVGWLAGLLERLLLRRVDVVVTVNDTIAARFSAMRKETHVVMNTVDRAWFEARLASSTGIRDRYPAIAKASRPIFLYQGSITRDRGIEVMVEAKRRTPGLGTLLIVGDSPVPGYLADLRERFGAEPDVIFTGRVPFEDVPGIVRESDVGLIVFARTRSGNGNNEAGLPNKLFEYMCAGIPVIASGFPEIRKVVGSDSPNGLLLADPSDPDELARHWRHLASDAGLRAQFGAAGANKVRTRYDFVQQVGMLSECYDRLTRLAP